MFLHFRFRVSLGQWRGIPDPGNEDGLLYCYEITFPHVFKISFILRLEDDDEGAYKMCLIYCSTRTCQKTVICVFLLDYQFKGLVSHQGIVALNSCWWPNGFGKVFLIHRIILFKPSFENRCFFYLTFTGNVPNKVFLINVFLLICHK